MRTLYLPGPHVCSDKGPRTCEDVNALARGTFSPCSRPVIILTPRSGRMCSICSSLEPELVLRSGGPPPCPGDPADVAGPPLWRIGLGHNASRTRTGLLPHTSNKLPFLSVRGRAPVTSDQAWTRVHERKIEQLTQTVAKWKRNIWIRARSGRAARRDGPAAAARDCRRLRCCRSITATPGGTEAPASSRILPHPQADGGGARPPAQLHPPPHKHTFCRFTHVCGSLRLCALRPAGRRRAARVDGAGVSGRRLELRLHGCGWP